MAIRQGNRQLTNPSGLSFTDKFSSWKADRIGFDQPNSHFSRLTGDGTTDHAHLELSGLQIEREPNYVRLIDSVGSVTDKVTEFP